MLCVSLEDHCRECGGGSKSKWRGKIGHRQPAPARPAAPGREGERESSAAAGPSMVSNVGGEGEREREEVNELCSLILNVTLKRELCSSR